MLNEPLPKWLEEQGSPSGEARRVILRVLEILDFLVIVFQVFDLHFDRMGKRLNGAISTI